MLVCALDHLFDSAPGPAADGGFGRALAVARNGDRIYLPGVRPSPILSPDVGTAYQAPLGGWKIRKSVSIVGDGPAGPGSYRGTTLVPNSPGIAGGEVLVIEPDGERLDHVHAQGLAITLRQNYGAQDGYDGVCLRPSAYAVGSIRLDRVRVLLMLNNGWDFEALDPISATVERLLLLDSTASQCGNVGGSFKNVRLALVVRSGVASNTLGGWLVEQCAVAFIASTGENNGTRIFPIAPHGQMRLLSCATVEADACHYEKFSVAKKEALAIEGGAGADGPAWVGSGAFSSGSPDVGAGTAVRIALSALGPATILPNRHTRVTKLVDAPAPPPGLVALPQFTDTTGGTEPTARGDIVLPPPPNGGMIASPTISRIGAFATTYAGLLTPSLAAEPTLGIQDGMLYYNTADNLFRVRIAGAWRTVRTATP